MAQFPDYFSILGLTHHYRLDPVELTEAYHRTQQQTHPDHASDAAAKQRAIVNAALVNEAYRALKDPALRALHLLQLHGADVSSNTLSETFLEEQLSLRETAENALLNRDADAVGTLRTRLIDASKQRQQKLGDCLDGKDVTHEMLQQALAIATELQFLERFRADLDEKWEYAEED